MRVLLVAIVIAFAAPPATAAVYRWTTPEGIIVYSDHPGAPDAEEVELPPLQTYTPPVLPSASSDSGKKTGEGSEGYDEFSITKPVNDEAIRDNGGTVSVQVTLKPALRSGDKLEIRLDGKSIGSGAATSVTLANVDRGAHTLSATIRDGKGQVVAEAPAVTFYLKRYFKRAP